MTSIAGIPRLDDREELFLIPGPREGMSLFLRRLAPLAKQAQRVVLYVHGATFPSALSIAHRFDGRSWRDALCEAGFSVWGLDFYGFGYSDRHPEMSLPADANAPLGLTAESTDQLASAVKFILEYEGRAALSMISHSWGSMPAGRFAGAHPSLVDRWVLFAPIARREPSIDGPYPSGPAWRMISAEDQWKRFVEDVPADEPPVLLRRHFNDWAMRYLATDPDAASSSPPAVKTPAGPFVEVLRAWNGELAYDPGLVQAPVSIIRGAWDGLVTDADARWLFDAFSGSTVKRDTKISRATHLMHLETTRVALWRQSIDFLSGEDEGNVQSASSQISPVPLIPHGANAMFSVIFEVNRKPDQQDEYLKQATHLKPILETIDGFIDNERFESQLRPGWLLSHSTWRDEKSLIRWRTQSEHHGVQEKGRFEIFRDYHLRVGEIVIDTMPPAGDSAGVSAREQRFDETESAEAKFATFTEITPADAACFAVQPRAIPAHVGLAPGCIGLLGHDIFTSINTPGKLALLCSWKSAVDAKSWKPASFEGVKHLRHRVVRVVRDYGMFDRREAPQYYEDVKQS